MSKIEIEQTRLEDLLEKLHEYYPVTARKLREEYFPEPEQNGYMGRWATHPAFGRVMCVWDRCSAGEVEICRLDRYSPTSGVSASIVYVDDLDFDPLVLETVEDFEHAPDGTVVENEKLGSMKKMSIGEWVGYGYDTNESMAKYGPWNVVRYGNGESNG